MQGTVRDTKLIEMYHADSNDNPAHEASMYISTAKLTKREKTADSIGGGAELMQLQSQEFNIKSKDTFTRGEDENDLVRMDDEEDDYANEIRSIDIDDPLKKILSREAYIKVYDNNLVTTDQKKQVLV